MDLGYAITYVFEDQKWISKLGILLVMMILAVIPFLGVITLALALGYGVMILRNFLAGRVLPLPEWEAYEQLLRDGGIVLLAIVIYHLPILLLNWILLNTIGGLSEGAFGSFSTIVGFCVILPSLLIATLVIWAILAVGLKRYIDTENPRAFYQAMDLFSVVRSHGSIVVQWVIYALMINLVFVFLGFTILGLLIPSALGLPIHMNLLGQYLSKVN